MMCTVLPVDGAGAVDVQAIRRRMALGLPPADVQEYLWRVRLEAQEIPDVVVSDVDPRQFDKQQTPNMPSLPAFSTTSVVNKALLPSRQWKQDLLADFAELRQLIARWQEIGPPEMDTNDEDKDDTMRVALRTNVPRMSDEDGWSAFFFGHAESGTVGTPPHLRLLLQFDQVLTRRLIEHHTDWLVNDAVPLSRARAVWIYALLARLDKPVHAGVAATIRQLLRRCWQMRNALQETVEPQALRSLNILICIAGDFFGQFDELD